jgi:transcriptional regulator with XRE-family HTH domain
MSTCRHVDDLYFAFGAQLRQSRRAAQLTQAAVGQRAGLSRTSIANIELGRQHFPFHILYRLAAAVHVDPTELLPDLGPPDVVPAHELDRFGLADDETAWVNEVVQRAQPADGQAD